ncbi:MAG: stage II sporulation protein P [Turicibacter sp.]|nr:stage II sporulation protein P [Turicibacter sp.]
MQRRKKKSNSQVPYLVGAFFVYILIATQFFPMLGRAHQFAWLNHFGPGFVAALDRPANHSGMFDNVHRYVFEMMSSVNLNQISTFVTEGLGLGGIVWTRPPVVAQEPTDFRFVRRENLVHDPETLSPPQLPAHVLFGDDPVVYIYNTHTWERFSDNASTVTDMSITMGEVFERNGIPTLVEDRSVEAFINERFGPFMAHRAYEGSRFFLEERISQFDSLRFFIDVHRDATVSDPWTTIDGVPYARVMFAIGMDNPNYRDNTDVAMTLAEMLEERKPGIMRNRPLFFSSGGPGRDGMFNQDLSAHALLIEIGDERSPAEAAFNTARFVAEVLSEYILGQLG